MAKWRDPIARRVEGDMEALSASLAQRNHSTGVGCGSSAWLLRRECYPVLMSLSRNALPASLEGALGPHRGLL